MQPVDTSSLIYRADNLTGMALKWLEENGNNFNTSFYTLLNYLSSLNKELKSQDSITCNEYANHFMRQYFKNHFPFEIEFSQPDNHSNILEFINAFDHAYLKKMIHSTFIELIHFLIQQKGTVNLLDFGTGQTCGLYGKAFLILFQEGRIDTNKVNFFGVDEVYEPKGAVFKKAYYIKSNITSFHPRLKFNLITGHHVLEHCLNWEHVIEHLSGLLKKEGYLYLSFPQLGGFYDTAYRLLNPSDHCGSFNLSSLQRVAENSGLELCLSDIYVDPNMKYNWICNLYPEMVTKEIADCFYYLCVSIDSKMLLGYHHYGYYVIFKKSAE